MESHSENIDMISCPSCSQGNEKKARFCVQCGNALPRERKFRLTNRRILFGALIGLVLSGGAWYLLANGIETKLVGKVNGEGITRKEYSKRLERAKRFYELRYGQNLFQGEEGKENLNRLKTEILDEMTTGKILLQEAENTGLSSAPDEEIAKQVEAIRDPLKHLSGDPSLKDGSNNSIEGAIK